MYLRIFLPSIFLRLLVLDFYVLAFEPAVHAAKDAPSVFWIDDFSDSKTLVQNWRSYGFPASGIDVKHPLGKPVSRKDARPEWWQIVDGALRGQCFPEEKHPPGLRRAISGTDIRLTCRSPLQSPTFHSTQTHKHSIIP